MTSTHSKPGPFILNPVRLLTGVVVLAMAIAAMPATGADRPNRVVTGESATVVLKAVPEKYQLEYGYVYELFTASADSSFWCGPNRPNPCSWLSLSVFSLERFDFQVQVCTADGDLIEEFDFEGVAPAVYSVDVKETNRSEAGRYLLRFRYSGVVVDEFPVRIAGSYSKAVDGTGQTSAPGDPEGRFHPGGNPDTET